MRRRCKDVGATLGRNRVQFDNVWAGGRPGGRRKPEHGQDSCKAHVVVQPRFDGRQRECPVYDMYDPRRRGKYRVDGYSIPDWYRNAMI